MANRFKLVLSLLKSLVQFLYQNELCRFNNSNCKYRLQTYEILCSGYIWVLYASSKRFVFGTNLKKTMDLFTFKFQYLSDIRNDESYPTFKGTVTRIEKVNRHDHFNSNNKR